MDVMRLIRVLVATALSGALALSGGPALGAAQAAPTEDAAVDSLLAKRIVNPRIGSDVGLIVLDAATGAVVSDHGGEQLMLPASNMKIITAVDILATMGVDARFTTRVVAGPTSTDLVLEGGGDPLLTSGILQSLARKAAKQLRPTCRWSCTSTTTCSPRPAEPRDGPPRTCRMWRLPSRRSPVSATTARTRAATPPGSSSQKLRSLGIPAALGEPADAAGGADAGGLRRAHGR